MVNNSTNINKTKESGGIVDHHSLNFLLFCWYWWNCWPSLFKLSFVLLILETVMVNNSNNINKTKESLNSDGRQFHQYQQIRENLNSDGQQFHQYQDIGGIVNHHCFNFLFFCLCWRNCWPSLFKLSFVLLIKRKFKQWWSNIPPISTKQTIISHLKNV
jgi:hypothetical protein